MKVVLDCSVDLVKATALNCSVVGVWAVVLCCSIGVVRAEDGGCSADGVRATKGSLRDGMIIVVGEVTECVGEGVKRLTHPSTGSQKAVFLGDCDKAADSSLLLCGEMVTLTPITSFLIP